MENLDPQHAIWATVILTLAKTCLPWFARQGNKIVDAWCQAILLKASRGNSQVAIGGQSDLAICLDSNTQSVASEIANKIAPLIKKTQEGIAEKTTAAVKEAASLPNVEIKQKVVEG